jgi:hypothetical protein
VELRLVDDCGRDDDLITLGRRPAAAGEERGEREREQEAAESVWHGGRRIDGPRNGWRSGPGLFVGAES